MCWFSRMKDLVHVSTSCPWILSLREWMWPSRSLKIISLEISWWSITKWKILSISQKCMFDSWTVWWVEDTSSHPRSVQVLSPLSISSTETTHRFYVPFLIRVMSFSLDSIIKCVFIGSNNLLCLCTWESRCDDRSHSNDHQKVRISHSSYQINIGPF